MADLAIETKDLGFQLEQVQDFTPTPMTMASVIYYSGIHPFTGEPVFTAKTREEKLGQRQFFFWYKNENRQAIRNTLLQIGEDKLAPKLFGILQKKETVVTSQNDQYRASAYFHDA